jgi:hypothetical protein
MICRKDSFQKLTQFSERSNVLDNSACNMAGMIWRETCFFSVVEQNNLKEKAFHHLETPQM